MDSNTTSFAYRLVDYIFIILGGLGTIMSAVIGYFVRTAHEKLSNQDKKIEDLKSEYGDFREDIAKEYVRNHTLEYLTTQINTKLSTIENDIKTLLQR